MRRVRILTGSLYHRDRDKILTKLVIFWGRGAFQGPSCTGRQNVTAFSRDFSLSPKMFKNRPCSGHVLRPARGWRVPNPPGLCHTVQSRKAQRRGNAMKRTKGISLLAALQPDGAGTAKIHVGMAARRAAADPVAHGSHQQFPLLLLMFVGKPLRCISDLFVHGSPLLFLSDITIPQTPQTFQPAALFCSASCWQKGTRCYL